MRLIIILGLFLNACTSFHKNPVPFPPVVKSLGKVDPQLSLVKLYRPDAFNDEQRFFLELKNSKNTKVDVNDKEIVVKYLKTKPPFKVYWVSQGQYQLEFSQEFEDLKQVKFLVQGKKLKHELVSFKKPAQSRSKLMLLRKRDHEISMRLILQDKKGAKVETQAPPEIILEGLGEVSSLNLIQNGIWDFTVGMPEENQIIYLNVRANGVQFDRFFRYQHIEK
jgi:hypothetical protein